MTATTPPPVGARILAAASEASAAAVDAERERARVRDAYLAAEASFIAVVAEAQRTGEADWRQVYEAYLLVKEWAELNGYTHFAERFQQHIPHPPARLRQFAEALPDPEQGSWSGATDWDGLERGGYPPNGVHVAFVVFDSASRPLRYGATRKFKSHTGRMHKSDGLRWSSWRAVPAADEHDARAKKHELERFHGQPAIATT